MDATNDPVPIHPLAAGSSQCVALTIDGLQVIDAWFAPGTTLPLHAHDSPAMGVLLDGEMEIDIVGTTRSCVPCTVGTEPRWEEHVNRIGPAGARVVSFEIAEHRLDGLDSCSYLLQRVHGFRDGEIAGTARRIGRELNHPDSASRLSVHSLVLDILVAAARVEAGRRRRRRPPAWLPAAEELLRTRFLEAVDLDALSRELGIGALALTRGFREHVGVSPASYQRQLRLEWAAGQLATGQDSISDLAVRAGFADQAHFTREFKRYTGLPPGRYRAARRN